MRLTLVSLTAFFFLGSSLSSCAYLNIARHEPAPTQSTAIQVPLNSFIFGFVPGSKIPPQSLLCPGGRIESATLEMTSNHVLLTLVTLGIYVPHRATVSCSK